MPRSLLQQWADARRQVFLDLVSPVASANKSRCHETDPDNPTTDPFFNMLLKKDNEQDLQALVQATSAMATDMTQFIEKRAPNGVNGEASH